MSICNYCTLKNIKKKAEVNNLKVKIICNSVFVYPEDVDFNVFTMPPEEKQKYFQVWLMNIPDHCCC